MFEKELYKGLLVWLDDLLGYGDSDEGLLALLTRILIICKAKHLELYPKKCEFWKKEALWCGRIVSRKKFRQVPERVCALAQLPSPSAGDELQQFVCAVNWMRNSIPRYNHMMEPLLKVLEKVYNAALEEVKTALFIALGAVITQIPVVQEDRDLQSQEHAPLMFLSGSFTGAQLH
uniref:PREDICTED: similar to OSJNBa0011F23.1 putative n=1 Tax=Albugo laibachii Nc14 TaxID=890382 RepID=F0WVN3_9STRA|nr:PREDICTED: similar to OSJNBa0011F23.1 putative [Albugo laibachii Nc14]|eukprot:CCA25477.1 PREDICTED: similar to OSJNBa0011F23.1 putative [Albugo laibachii Nc14]